MSALHAYILGEFDTNERRGLSNIYKTEYVNGYLGNVGKVKFSI